jgi:hypothetical protein
VGLRAGLDKYEKSRRPPGFDPRTVQLVDIGNLKINGNYFRQPYYSAVSEFLICTHIERRNFNNFNTHAGKIK